MEYRIVNARKPKERKKNQKQTPQGLEDHSRMVSLQRNDILASEQKKKII